MYLFPIFILSAMGATMIVTQGEIFRPLREAIEARSKWLGKLISCPMCFGVYAGWAIQGLIVWSTGTPLKAYFILYGFINSICSYTIVVVVNTIEAFCIRMEAEHEAKLKLYKQESEAA